MSSGKKRHHLNKAGADIKRQEDTTGLVYLTIRWFLRHNPDKTLTTKPSTKASIKIKLLEEDEDFPDNLEDSDAELDDDSFNFDDDLDDNEE